MKTESQQKERDNGEGNEETSIQKTGNGREGEKKRGKNTEVRQRSDEQKRNKF